MRGSSSERLSLAAGTQWSMFTSMGIEIVHKSTLELEADVLTKVLGKAKLASARRRLELR